MALYLAAPIERELVVPTGADIPSHLWRVRLVTEQGLDALFDSARRSIQTNPDRLGLPVLGSLLSGVGVSPWRLMYVTAAVSAAVVACSAWGSRARGEGLGGPDRSTRVPSSRRSRSRSRAGPTSTTRSPRGCSSPSPRPRCSPRRDAAQRSQASCCLAAPSSCIGRPARCSSASSSSSPWVWPHPRGRSAVPGNRSRPRSRTRGGDRGGRLRRR